MAEISASRVKELRERTGLGMMECKAALSESGGDLDKAEDLLRVRKGAKATKVAGRVAAEGIVAGFVSADGRTGALVEVNCETDFVAKNDELVAFGAALAQRVVEDGPADTGALAALALAGGSVEERRQALVQKIGENISIRRFERISTAAKIALYLHGAKIGVLAEYEGPEDVGKDLALHIAFFRPRYMARAEIPADVLAREREILVARANESGKPPEIVAKMVEGGLGKFAAEMTLLGQPFVKDDKRSVEKMLAARSAAVKGYRFLVVGEGIERKSD